MNATCPTRLTSGGGPHNKSLKPTCCPRRQVRVVNGYHVWLTMGFLSPSLAGCRAQGLSRLASGGASRFTHAA